MKPNFKPYPIAIKHLEEAVPYMRYDGGETPEAWQERARGLLGELLGLSAFQYCDPLFAIEYDRAAETPTGQKVREIRFTVQTEKGYFVPCQLWIPADVPVPLPVCICLQGHSTGKHISFGKPIYPRDSVTISGGDRDFAVRACQEGFAALGIDQRCMGECGSHEDGAPFCYETAMTMLLTGRTLLGARVWDISRVIDVLGEIPELDTDRILCMGNSGGGTATTYAAAMDPRITYAMPSCAVCDYDRSIGIMNHCACNFVPRIANYFDMGDLLGLIAPRPLVVVSGERDPIFLLDGAKSSVAEGRKLYKAMGAEELLRHVVGDGEHRFYADPAWAALHEIIGK